ncbi:hypothetical protein BD560DRAFT_386933 [Blakeslea trispora]|nr:hypothetical protein BD560DRAFT_386933 [Blakeslea trispora]
MQRNLLFLQQQQALVRQAQQQKAAASAALANNGQVPDQLNLWMQQQQQQQPGGAFNPSIDAKPWLQQQQTLQQSLPLQQQQQPQPQPQQQQHQQQQHQQQQQQAVPKTVGMMQRKSQPVLSTQSLPFDTVHVETVRHKKNLKTYMDRDNRYQVTLDRQHKRHVELAQQKKQEIDLANQTRRERAQHKGMSTFGLGYNGYGNGKTGPPTPYTRITYPGEKKRKRQQIRIPLQHCIEQAKKEELLVPIRLDIDQDGYRVRDTFTWNLNESLISPEQFAEITCDDLRLPVPVFGPLIAASIKEQIQDFDLNMSSMVVQEDSKVDAYQEFIRSKKQKTDKEEEEKVVEKKPMTELRTIIKLDIIVGHRILNDQFEWDITCQHNSPEMFAEKMVTDLGLGGEFKTAIAHSIREQVHVYIKSLLLTGHDFSDNLVENDELRRSFLPTVRNVIREGQYLERFTPSLLELTESEMDKIEKGRIRESRRKRRGVRNRKGVVSLPDRDPIPTFRTIFASPPEHEMTDDQFLKSMQINNSIEAHHSQRKSAAKARMNIAAEAAGVSLTSGQLEDHVDQITRPVSNKLVHPSWRCVDCGCSPFMTSIVRSSNQTGEKSLCNACGLYRYKYNSVRPRNYVEKDMVNEIPHMNDWQNHLTKYR